MTAVPTRRAKGGMIFIASELGAKRYNRKLPKRGKFQVIKKIKYDHVYEVAILVSDYFSLINTRRIASEYFTYLKRNIACFKAQLKIRASILPTLRKHTALWDNEIE